MRQADYQCCKPCHLCNPLFCLSLYNILYFAPVMLIASLNILKIQSHFLQDYKTNQKTKVMMILFLSSKVDVLLMIDQKIDLFYFKISLLEKNLYLACFNTILIAPSP
jgi:hypothetical protein